MTHYIAFHRRQQCCYCALLSVFRRHVLSVHLDTYQVRFRNCDCGIHTLLRSTVPRRHQIEKWMAARWNTKSMRIGFMDSLIMPCTLRNDCRDRRVCGCFSGGLFENLRSENVSTRRVDVTNTIRDHSWCRTELSL